MIIFHRREAENEQNEIIENDIKYSNDSLADISASEHFAHQNIASDQSNVINGGEGYLQRNLILLRLQFLSFAS